MRLLGITADDILWTIRAVYHAKMLRNAEKSDRLMPQIMAISTIEGDNWRWYGM